MKNTILFPVVFILAAFATALILFSAGASQTGAAISGTVEEGYRVLTVPSSGEGVEYTVYRGDYLKFRFDEKLQPPILSIPALAISKDLGDTLQKAPYFKMKKTGEYPFSLGLVSGHIRVVEYDKPQYKAVTLGEASNLIANLSPLILDVRTFPEYASGHLQNSLLIPVQEIQQRFGELSDHRDDNILIYCATGNRSTVAAKILIDNGFTRIYNMREGLHTWTRSGYPVVR